MVEEYEKVHYLCMRLNITHLSHDGHTNPPAPPSFPSSSVYPSSMSEDDIPDYADYKYPAPSSSTPRYEKADVQLGVLADVVMLAGFVCMILGLCAWYIPFFLIQNLPYTSTMTYSEIIANPYKKVNMVAGMLIGMLAGAMVAYMMLIETRITLMHKRYGGLRGSSRWYVHGLQYVIRMIGLGLGVLGASSLAAMLIADLHTGNSHYIAAGIAIGGISAFMISLVIVQFNPRWWWWFLFVAAIALSVPVLFIVSFLTEDETRAATDLIGALIALGIFPMLPVMTMLADRDSDAGRLITWVTPWTRA